MDGYRFVSETWSRERDLPWYLCMLGAVALPRWPDLDTLTVRYRPLHDGEDPALPERLPSVVGVPDLMPEGDWVVQDGLLPRGHYGVEAVDRAWFDEDAVGRTMEVEWKAGGLQGWVSVRNVDGRAIHRGDPAWAICASHPTSIVLAGPERRPVARLRVPVAARRGRGR